MENCWVRSPYPLEVPGFLDVQVFEILLKKHNFDKNKRLRLRRYLWFILAFLVGGAGGGENKYVFGEEYFDDALLNPGGEGCT